MTTLLLCLGAWFYGFQIIQSFEDISAIRSFKAASVLRLTVVANQALHTLDDSGRRVARQNLQSFGLKAAPNGMDWTVDALGQVEAWFFEDNPVRVLSCV